MSYNKHGEYELCCWVTGANKYFISRDRAGAHVLREGGSDGKELFSPVGDDGKKNKKTGRVINASLLFEKIELEEEYGNVARAKKSGAEA